MELQVEHNGDKRGRRLHAMRECFHRALKIALSCPTWEVRELSVLRTTPGTQNVFSNKVATSMQEFETHFDNLPEHYVAGLFDLIQQVSC